ncbi:MAG: hypothetical protein U0263_12310 [Polyangiaceae bacterium]
MISREPFRQELVGSYTTADSLLEQPARLRLESEQRVLLPGLGKTLRVTGSLDAKGLADARGVSGRITFARLAPFVASYDLALTIDDGRSCRLHAAPAGGSTSLRAWTSVVGDLVDGSGARVARFVLRFDYRRDLLGYLT